MTATGSIALQIYVDSPAVPGPEGVEPSPLWLEQAPTVDWATLGIEPRWNDMDSSDCVAALVPALRETVLIQKGDEAERFLTSVSARGETAVVVVGVGHGVPDQWGRRETRVWLPDMEGTVYASPAPSAPRVEIADGLTGPEKDLALRLKSGHEGDWWTVRASRFATEPIGLPLPAPDQDSGAALRPILVNGAGEPLAAVWTSEDPSMRWYFVPGTVQWKMILDWLTASALPTFAPAALRRVRRDLSSDPELQTQAESNARRALDKLITTFELERAELEQNLERAREAGDAVRHDLLYGSGEPLQRAVAAVLVDAGLDVEDLDAELGTRSADLLVSHEHGAVLVEVKSSRKRPGERLVDDLKRHIETWPELRPGHPLSGGVLVINHDHELDPLERPREVFTRPEFVESLDSRVISSLELFEWWRLGDHDAIAGAFSPSTPRPDAPIELTEPAPSATNQSSKPRGRRRWLPG